MWHWSESSGIPRLDQNTLAAPWLDLGCTLAMVIIYLDGFFLWYVRMTLRPPRWVRSWLVSNPLLFFFLTYTLPCTPLLRIYYALYVSTFPLKPNNGPGSFPIGGILGFPRTPGPSRPGWFTLLIKHITRSPAPGIVGRLLFIGYKEIWSNPECLLACYIPRTINIVYFTRFSAASADCWTFHLRLTRHWGILIVQNLLNTLGTDSSWDWV